MSEGEYGLIGFSSSFEDRHLFAKKFVEYLGPLDRCPNVVVINDVHGLIGSSLGGSVLSSIPPSMSLREKRALVRESRFALLFWDGATLNDFVFLSRFYGVPTRLVAVETTRVVNKDRGEEFDVYIGRGTPWGNPFAIGDKGADRAAVIEMYKEYFRKKFVEDAEGNRDIRKLKGKVLACHCKPNACHGDIIARYLNSLSD